MSRREVEGRTFSDKGFATENASEGGGGSSGGGKGGVLRSRDSEDGVSKRRDPVWRGYEFCEDSEDDQSREARADESDVVDMEECGDRLNDVTKSESESYIVEPFSSSSSSTSSADCDEKQNPGDDLKTTMFDSEVEEVGFDEGTSIAANAPSHSRSTRPSHRAFGKAEAVRFLSEFGRETEPGLAKKSVKLGFKLDFSTDSGGRFCKRRIYSIDDSGIKGSLYCPICK